MHTWQLQEAKAQLSEVVKLCLKEGPQLLSVRGVDTAVLVSKKTYEELMGIKPSFVDFMQQSPLKGVELDLSRDTSLPREVEDL